MKTLTFSEAISRLCIVLIEMNIRGAESDRKEDVPPSGGSRWPMQLRSEQTKVVQYKCSFSNGLLWKDWENCFGCYSCISSVSNWQLTLLDKNVGISDLSNKKAWASCHSLFVLEELVVEAVASEGIHRKLAVWTKDTCDQIVYKTRIVGERAVLYLEFTAVLHKMSFPRDTLSEQCLDVAASY